MTNNITAKCAIVVLAGGHSRRMGRRNKALLTFAGKPLIQHVLSSVSKQSDMVIINSNRALPADIATDNVSVSDYLGEGPLAGIAAGLRWINANKAGTKWLISVSCDCPFLPLDLASQLISTVQKQKADCCYAADDTGSHYIISAWSSALHGPLEHALTEGQYAVHQFLNTINATKAYFQLPSEKAIPSYFYNVNTPDDLERLEAGFSTDDDKE